METKAESNRVITIDGSTRALNERDLRKNDVVHVYLYRGKKNLNASVLDDNIRLAIRHCKTVTGKTPAAAERIKRIKRILRDTPLPPRDLI